MNRAPSTLPELLRESVKRNPEGLALLFKDRRFTYADFQRETNRVAGALLRLGVRKGDKVGLLLPNCPEFLFSIFAMAQIGAVSVPINTAYTREEGEYVLHHSEASVLLSTREFLSLVDSIRGRVSALKHVILTDEADEPECLSWDKFLFQVDAGTSQIDVAAGDLASITYTSGTTDRPKGVMLSR